MHVIARAKASLVEFRLDKLIGGSGITSVDVIIVDVDDNEGRTGLGFSYALGGLASAERATGVPKAMRICAGSRRFI